MNVLYKYCDQNGIVRILEDLELKLPCIIDVNDPYECFPFLYYPDDKPAMKNQWLQTFQRNNISPPSNWEETLDKEFEKGEIQKTSKNNLLQVLMELNQKSYLLSVSKTAQNTVMWAHYAKQHKGAAIGIDFNNIYSNTNSVSNILMHAVSYPEERPKINIFSELSFDEFRKISLIKSSDWEYEKEFRTIFILEALEKMRQQELANLKDFDGKDTWFLKLNPASIKEVVFGLDTEDNLKEKIRKLKKRKDLQHIQLRQAALSETYDFDITNTT